MKVLVVGAAGFIGKGMCRELIAAGHDLVVAGRDRRVLTRLYPMQSAHQADFVQAIGPQDWESALDGVEAVINAAGVLQPSDEIAWAVHRDMPKALVAACEMRGVKRFIQISALGIDPPPPGDPVYCASKRAGDEAVMESALDWTILRPSLVLTPEDAYGGSAFLRALAAFPVAIPLPGLGDQVFRPIAMQDLAKGVRHILEEGKAIRQVVSAVGPEVLTVREILLGLRQWMGIQGKRVFKIPMVLISLSAKLGDKVGVGPVKSTSLAMMAHGNSDDDDGWR